MNFDTTLLIGSPLRVDEFGVYHSPNVCFATGAWLSLQDAASRTDPEGKTRDIVELLSQCNDFPDDLAWKQANEKTGHLFILRSSLPAGYFTSYYQGVPYGKSTTGQARVGTGMLKGYSQVDRDLARHYGDVEELRASEDVAFLEGMSQTMVRTFFYGNATLQPQQFSGLSFFYNTVNTANSTNAVNVLNGGGTGNSNASMWLIGHGAETQFAVYPLNSKAGLIMEDKGDTVPGFDNLGNRFEAHTTFFEQEAGWCPADWRYGVRLANLDVTNAGLAGPNAFDLFVGMDNMLLKFPKLSASTSGITKTDAPRDETGDVHPYFYVNRTVKHFLFVQSVRNRNVLLSDKDYAGRPVEHYRGVGIHTVDQLLNTEATVN